VDVAQQTERPGAVHLRAALPLHRYLQTWLDSPERRTLIAEATPMLADGDKTEIGAVNEFWFAPRPTAPPPALKQAVVTLLVILPLTLLVPIVGPLLIALRSPPS
jgi:antibiotic biosynthesis monooxygenase (ABM) superfamily enzyme